MTADEQAYRDWLRAGEFTDITEQVNEKFAAYDGGN